MEYVADQFEVGPVTVKIVLDDFCSWDDHMGDEPINVFAFDSWSRSWSVNDGKADIPDEKTCRDIERQDWQEIVACNVLDYAEKDDGRVIVYHDGYYHAVTYASMRNAARGVLRRQGFDLDNIRVEQLSSQRDTFYCAWSQTELDKYAGVKNTKAFTDTIQHILDGDIWGYVIEDENGDTLDSIWGFIGDSDDEYLLSEAKDAAQYHADLILAEQARELEESRGDMVAS